MTEKYLHPFPARMAPEIALRELGNLPAGSIVVDPMAGSGTTLRAAVQCGLDAHGFDLDPLAVKLARAESCRLDPVQVSLTAKRILRRFAALDRRRLCRYPEWFDEETKEFVARWFPRYNQTALSFISSEIAGIADEDVRTLLEVAFSGTIIVKEAGCSFARDVAHSRPHMHHEYEPRRAEDLFAARIKRCVDICEARRGILKRSASVRLGDSRHLPLAANFADIIITSPPYLNALDYMRGHRLSLVWLGHTLSELRKIRAHAIGSENLREFNSKVLSRQEALQQRYIIDMRSMISEAARVLKPGGAFVCVVGDNKPHIGPSNARLVREIAESTGMVFTARRRRAIPKTKRYLPPPGRGNSALDARMVWESILTFNKRT